MDNIQHSFTSGPRKLFIRSAAASQLIDRLGKAYHVMIYKPILIPLGVKRKYPLSSDLKVISFDYACSDYIDYIGISIDNHIVYIRNIAPSDKWSRISIDISRYKKILDRSILATNIINVGIIVTPFPTSPAVSFKIKNIVLRPLCPEELLKEDLRNSYREKKNVSRINPDEYLHYPNFPCKIIRVRQVSSQIEIWGEVCDTYTDFYLCELPMYGDFAPEDIIPIVRVPEQNSKFNICIERFCTVEDTVYDRLYSRWAIGVGTEDGVALCSAGHYVDDMESVYSIPKIIPRNKKGLGGLSRSLHETDLDELDISYTTLDICLNDFIRLDEAKNTDPFTYNDHTYFIDAGQIGIYDLALQAAAGRNIDVAAIILVCPEWRSPDKKAGSLLEHPEYNLAGNYTLPNMTTPESLNLYAAAIDFLASRYSRPDKKYGHIHRWIVHHEVDKGWVWANAGEKNMAEYMELYLKSMRLIYYTALKYDANSEVLISLSHFWTGRMDKNYCYPPAQMLQLLTQYSQIEGDFRWGIAYHPYPETPWNPKIWVESRATDSDQTEYITFKNLEIINAWIKRPEVFYKSNKRTLLVSGQNPNSPDDTDHALVEQAACLAYTWKKTIACHGIDAYIVRRWMDARSDGGIKTGLRRYPDDKNPYGRKPSWYLFRDLGTAREEESCCFAKKIMGINDWEEIISLPGKNE